jgi:2-oxoglutarate dehydrogenase N-terminus
MDRLSKEWWLELPSKNVPNLACSGHFLHLFSALTADSLRVHIREIAKERSVSQSGQDFGANDWLVEEMYERYQADPTSVPTEWVTYFQNNPQAGASVSNAPKGGTPPTPKPVTPPNISFTQSSPSAPAAPATPAPAAPVQSQPVVRNVNAAPATPAQPVAKPIPTLATPSASSLEPIRGVAARVVQSMEASLTTSSAHVVEKFLLLTSSLTQ